MNVTERLSLLTMCFPLAGSAAKIGSYITQKLVGSFVAIGGKGRKVMNSTIRRLPHQNQSPKVMLRRLLSKMDMEQQFMPHVLPLKTRMK
jgi:hypothetical protein